MECDGIIPVKVLVTDTVFVTLIVFVTVEDGFRQREVVVVGT